MTQLPVLIMPIKMSRVLSHRQWSFIVILKKYAITAVNLVAVRVYSHRIPVYINVFPSNWVNIPRRATVITRSILQTICRTYFFQNRKRLSLITGGVIKFILSLRLWLLWVDAQDVVKMNGYGKCDSYHINENKVYDMFFDICHRISVVFSWFLYILEYFTSRLTEINGSGTVTK